MMNVSVWIPSAAIFALAIGLLVYASRKHKGMYTLYMAAYIVVNCSVTWLISGARYMTACVPMFVILGVLLDKKEKTYRSITIISSVLMGIYFVGYMMSKQIM